MCLVSMRDTLKYFISPDFSMGVLGFISYSLTLYLSWCVKGPLQEPIVSMLWSMKIQYLHLISF